MPNARRTLILRHGGGALERRCTGVRGFLLRPCARSAPVVHASSFDGVKRYASICEALTRGSSTSCHPPTVTTSHRRAPDVWISRHRRQPRLSYLPTTQRAGHGNEAAPQFSDKNWGGVEGPSGGTGCPVACKARRGSNLRVFRHTHTKRPKASGR